MKNDDNDPRHSPTHAETEESDSEDSETEDPDTEPGDPEAEVDSKMEEDLKITEYPETEEEEEDPPELITGVPETEEEDDDLLEEDAEYELVSEDDDDAQAGYAAHMYPSHDNISFPSYTATEFLAAPLQPYSSAPPPEFSVTMAPPPPPPPPPLMATDELVSSVALHYKWQPLDDQQQQSQVMDTYM